MARVDKIPPWNKQTATAHFSCIHSVQSPAFPCRRLTNRKVVCARKHPCFDSTLLPFSFTSIAVKVQLLQKGQATQPSRKYPTLPTRTTSAAVFYCSHASPNSTRLSAYLFSNPSCDGSNIMADQSPVNYRHTPPPRDNSAVSTPHDTSNRTPIPHSECSSDTDDFFCLRKDTEVGRRIEGASHVALITPVS